MWSYSNDNWDNKTAKQITSISFARSCDLLVDAAANAKILKKKNVHFNKYTRILFSFWFKCFFFAFIIVDFKEKMSAPTTHTPAYTKSSSYCWLIVIKSHTWFKNGTQCSATCECALYIHLNDEKPTNKKKWNPITNYYATQHTHHEIFANWEAKIFFCIFFFLTLNKRKKTALRRLSNYKWKKQGEIKR